MSLLLSLPGTNAFIERVFSVINRFWTTEKAELSLRTLQAVIGVKLNVNLLCEKFCAKLAGEKDILKKIHRSDKYD